MKTGTRLAIFLLIAIWTVTGCASLDDYLETSLSIKPTVIYDLSISRAKSDALVLLGIEDPSAIFKFQYVSLDFFMNNTNKDLGIIDISTKKTSNYLQFSEMTGQDLANLRLLFPVFKNMSVFAVRLQGLTVSSEQLDKYKVLNDGEWKHIEARNAELINDRKTTFLVASISDDRADTIMVNTFREAK